MILETELQRYAGVKVRGAIVQDRIGIQGGGTTKPTPIIERQRGTIPPRPSGDRAPGKGKRTASYRVERGRNLRTQEYTNRCARSVIVGLTSQSGGAGASAATLSTLGWGRLVRCAVNSGRLHN